MSLDFQALRRDHRLCEEVRDFISHFANGIRLKLLCELMLQGDANVGDLVRAVGGSQPAVSQHLKTLRLSGLVSRQRVGNQCLYRISDPRVVATMEYLHGLAESLLAIRVGSEAEHTEGAGENG